MNLRTFLVACALAAPSFAADGAAAPAPAPAPAPQEDPADDAVSAPAPAPAPVPVFAPPSAARASSAPPAPRTAASEPVAAPKAEDLAPERFSFDLSSRGVSVRDDALGVFSSERKIGIGGLAGRGTVYREGAWAVAVGAAIEGRDALSGKARGADVSVELHRPTLRLEATYELTRYVDAALALGVGGQKLTFRYVDAATSESASAETWKATADLGVGVDAHTRLGPVLIGVRLEGGLLASGAHALRVALPDVGDVSRQPIDLGTLAMSGAFTRFALRVGY